MVTRYKQTINIIVMSTQEEIHFQQELLSRYRQNLRYLLKQVADQGGEAYAQLSVLNNIKDARENIYQSKTILRNWNIAVEDMPIDEETRPHAQSASPRKVSATSNNATKNASFVHQEVSEPHINSAATSLNTVHSPVTVLPRNTNVILGTLVLYLLAIILIARGDGEFGLPFLIILIIITSGFLFYRYTVIKYDTNAIRLRQSLKENWNEWNRKIELELEAKWYVKLDDLKNVADRLGIEIDDFFVPDNKILETVFQEYERRNAEKVIYAYVYSRKTGKPYDYNQDTDGTLHPKRLLISRKKFPKNSYEYSAQVRLFKK